MAKHDKYWFKRRRFGYGWVPVTWQGWSVLAVYIIIIILGAVVLKDVPKNTFTKETGFYLLFLLVASIALIKISFIKGPSPKWRWGKKPSDNPSEDY